MYATPLVVFLMNMHTVQCQRRRRAVTILLICINLTINC